MDIATNMEDNIRYSRVQVIGDIPMSTHNSRQGRSSLLSVGDKSKCPEVDRSKDLTHVKGSQNIQQGQHILESNVKSSNTMSYADAVKCKMTSKFISKRHKVSHEPNKQETPKPQHIMEHNYGKPSSPPSASTTSKSKLYADAVKCRNRSKDTGGAFREIVHLKQDVPSMYTVCNVPGDGNCFFQALSMATNNNLQMTQNYHDIICTHIHTNWSVYSMLATTVHDLQLPSKAAYWNHMVVGMGWATSCELQAAVDIFDINIRTWFKCSKHNGSTNEISYVPTTFHSQHSHLVPTYDFLISDNHYYFLKRQDEVAESGTATTTAPKIKVNEKGDVKATHKRKPTESLSLNIEPQKNK